jgi:hypothetical protein
MRIATVSNNVKNITHVQREYAPQANTVVDQVTLTLGVSGAINL